MTKQIAILGAGMVGVCCALSLQRRGYAVTLIDRKLPGRETSFGNSGVFSRGSVFPINGPGLLSKLPGYISNRSPAVRWQASLLKHPIWLARFLAECTAASTVRRSHILNGLIERSMELNRALIAEAGISHRLRESGWLKVWRAPAPGVAEGEARALAAFGIKTAVLDGAGIAQLEPAAERVFQAGLHILESASVDDPAAVVAAYADMFVRNGGGFIQAEVRDLTQTASGWRIDTSSGAHEADAVVIALGPWSGDLMAKIGLAVPMFHQRGYHLHLAIPDGGGPRRSVYDVDGGYVVGPMAAGARVTTGVELADRDAQPSTSQIDAAVALARRTFHLGEAVEREPWLGSRPTLPDSLPVIGEVPRRPGLNAAFGHNHIGFSTGAATGEIIASTISGDVPPVDAEPFDPKRYLL